jgi:hypothetical protein
VKGEIIYFSCWLLGNGGHCVSLQWHMSTRTTKLRPVLNLVIRSPGVGCLLPNVAIFDRPQIVASEAPQRYGTKCTDWHGLYSSKIGHPGYPFKRVVLKCTKTTLSTSR